VILARRKLVNASYSLRAFARTLRTDHSTLSQVMRGRRRVTAKSVRAWGARLGMSDADIREFCELENEAAILAVLDKTGFRADSRWLAVTLNIPLDDINIALQRLLRTHQLRMRARHHWERGSKYG
jgi:hypothetical protein